MTEHGQGFRAGSKDNASVTSDGRRHERLIEGLIIRWLTPQEDKRGEVIEAYRDEWQVHPAPIVQVCQISVRPGHVKGWVVHEHHEDRIYHCRGTVRWGFFDDRPASPTHGLVNVITLSERRRALIVIPRGVFHAVENLDVTEAIFLDMPTRAYDYDDPDKRRLPLKNDIIPFAFDDGRGW